MSRQSEIDDKELNAFLDDYYKQQASQNSSQSSSTSNESKNSSALYCPYTLSQQREICEDHFGVRFSQSSSSSSSQSPGSTVSSIGPGD